MKTLSTRKIRVVRAVAGTLFDPGGGCDPARTDWFIDDLDDFLLAAGIKTRIALHAALFTIQFAPLFLIGRFALFTSLSAEDRLRVLERYEVSPLSLMFAAVKLVFALIYFEHPDTMRECLLDPRLVWPGVEQSFGKLPAVVEPVEEVELVAAAQGGRGR